MKKESSLNKTKNIGNDSQKYILNKEKEIELTKSYKKKKLKKNKKKNKQNKNYIGDYNIKIKKKEELIKIDNIEDKNNKNEDEEINYKKLPINTNEKILHTSSIKSSYEKNVINIK